MIEEVLQTRVVDENILKTTMAAAELELIRQDEQKVGGNETSLSVIEPVIEDVQYSKELQISKGSQLLQHFCISTFSILCIGHSKT